MKPPPFRYFAPESIAEILELFEQYGEEARPLAGGQSLVALMSLRMGRPEILIDLNRCPALATIERASNHIAYGAMVRQIDAQKSDLTRDCCPLIAKALVHAGPVAIRSRGTVGGMLAHADRSAELPGVAMALDAIMVIESSAGQRRVPAEEFFLGDMTTAVEPHEILRAALFPICDRNAVTAFYEVGLREEGVAIAGLATQLDIRDGVVVSARLAVTGVEPAPLRLRSVEAAIAGLRVDETAIRYAVELATEAVDPMDDAQATARYRRHVVGALVERALAALSVKGYND